MSTKSSDNSTLYCVCAACAVIVIGVVVYLHLRKGTQKYVTPSQRVNIRSRDGGFTDSVNLKMMEAMPEVQRPAAVLFWNQNNASYYVTKYWNDVVGHVEQTFPVDTLNVECHKNVGPYCSDQAKIFYFPEGYNPKNPNQFAIPYMGIFEEHAIDAFISLHYGNSLFPTQQ
jgi:hypothetical protein